MKKRLSIMLLVCTIFMSGCSMNSVFETVSDSLGLGSSNASVNGRKITEQKYEDFENGAAVYYEETYPDSDEYYIYTRDSEGNIHISCLIEGVQHDYYFIDDVYYDYYDNELYDEYTESDGTMEDNTEYILEMIDFIGIETFATDTEADYSVVDDQYVASGKYDNDQSYVVEVAKDGSTMTSSDTDFEALINFVFEETIQLP